MIGGNPEIDPTQRSRYQLANEPDCLAPCTTGCLFSKDDDDDDDASFAVKKQKKKKRPDPEERSLVLISRGKKST